MRTIVAELIVAAFLFIPAIPAILELADMLPSDLIPGAMVAAAVTPALLLLWLVVIADSRPEPQRIVLLCVGLGALSTLPAYVIEAWVDAHSPITSNLWTTAYAAALLSAGLPEEALKVSIIAAVAWRDATLTNRWTALFMAPRLGSDLLSLKTFSIWSAPRIGQMSPSSVLF